MFLKVFYFEQTYTGGEVNRRFPALTLVRQSCQTSGNTVRQTERQTDRQTDTLTSKQTGRQTNRRTDRRTNRKADRLSIPESRMTVQKLFSNLCFVKFSVA